jgi:spermidine synthase
VGITAKSFHNLGINVTAIEIDPIVHQFAEKYFGLPSKLNVFHEDGRAFIESAGKRGEKWDFIVHDVFTGGSMPSNLFTTEMWTATKAVLADDGVVAVVNIFLSIPLK